MAPITDGGAYAPGRARRDLSLLSLRTYDLIVIGGGITGAGIAQDAASRGLKTLLVEKGDFAGGTSSKSTKLIHGGLRYLQQLQFKVTRESVREREVQRKLAPHLVWDLPFIIPTYTGKKFKNFQLGLGLQIYDLMAGLRRDRRHKRISAAEARRLCPGIKEEGLTGGFVYSDCRTDDARHTLEVIQSAVQQGAVVCNYVRVTGLLKEQGRVTGVEVVDNLPADGDMPDRAVVRLQARCVVNATGVWMQEVCRLAQDKSGTQVLPAKGVHVTVSQSRLPLNCALVVPSVHDKRYCFAVPWYDAVLIGTTDTAYTGDLDKIEVTAEETGYLLDSVNALLPDAHLSEADITSKFAGLRPLIKDAGQSSTSDLSRQHRLQETKDGLISIAGGKLTTYRLMAEQTVNRVVKDLAAGASHRKYGPCRTGEIMLGGWETGDDVLRMSDIYKDMAVDAGLDQQTAAYLLMTYGKRAGKLLELIKEDPRDLCRRLCANHPYIAAQIVYAVRQEAALTLEDVLSRRIRLAIVDTQAALAAAEPAAILMSQELGWSPATMQLQLDRLRKDWL